jgi:hypothetical protein
MAGPERPRDSDPPGYSFDEFYAANVHRLTLMLYVYTADVQLAQDCVQEGSPEPGRVGSGSLPTTIRPDGSGAWR